MRYQEVGKSAFHAPAREREPPRRRVQPGCVYSRGCSGCGKRAQAFTIAPGCVFWVLVMLCARFAGVRRLWRRFCLQWEGGWLLIWSRCTQVNTYLPCRQAPRSGKTTASGGVSSFDQKTRVTPAAGPGTSLLEPRASLALS